MSSTATAQTDSLPAALPPSPGLRWPTPPYASYGEHEHGYPSGLDCVVEGSNGQKRACRLLALDLDAGVAKIQVPPSVAVMPLRFDMFRRISLNVASRTIIRRSMKEMRMCSVPFIHGLERRFTLEGCLG